MRHDCLRLCLAIWLSLCLLPLALAGDDKPTSLSDAQAAVEANLRTADGKKYDDQVGNEFVQNHLSEVRQCKAAAGGDMRSFWFLLKLDHDGSVKEVLLYPSTKLGECSRDALLKDKLSAPPHAAYWASVYMKLN